MEKKTKIAGAVGAAAIIGLSGLVGAGIADDSATVKQLQEQVSALENVEPVIINETVTEIVEVPVEVEKIVEVDNGNLELVLDHIYDNGGNVVYLTEDLDEDEVQLIVDRISFIDDVKKLAVEYVKKEGLDELDRRDVNGTELDEDEIERFKVYDWDEEETVVDKVDFEDGDAEVLVTARFEQDDVDYEAVFRVEFEEGEVDDVVIESIVLR